ncbi:hypothetical protein [Jiangella sp. DSM 45060]|uniref:hypothetical protein n=1 Tax=Jiangella sp. DSM 45060 TaxID=1798224 RepID=UPI00087CFA8C|nr:hypothetical protein [Jiangella sp. DSM 45060]SDT68640.1 hypothetical protein SAMN04515669_5901 [Jiangella sp. DSM 45060]
MTRPRSSLLLVAAAAVLAVVGLLLVFGGGGDDGGGGSAGGAAGAAPSPAASADPGTPDDGDAVTPDDAGSEPPAVPPSDLETDAATSDDADEPLEPSDTPTAQPTPAPRQTPTLPPGMRQPEPVVVPDPATVDDTDPTAVAVAALTAAYSFDAASDTSAEDAMARVQTWLAAPHDDAAYDLDGLQQDVQRDWEQWARHQAFASINAIDPHTTDVDTPDTATRAERRFYVRMTPIGRDAWNGPLVEHQWFAFLARASADEPWRVVELQTPLAHR